MVGVPVLQQLEDEFSCLAQLFLVGQDLSVSHANVTLSAIMFLVFSEIIQQHTATALVVCSGVIDNGTDTFRVTFLQISIDFRGKEQVFGIFPPLCIANVRS